MNQQKRMLQMLEGGDWISSVQFIDAYMQRFGDVIFKLRKQGHTIEKRRRSGNVWEYRLAPEIEQNGQYIIPGCPARIDSERREAC